MQKHDGTKPKTNESGIKIAVGGAKETKDAEMTEDEVREVPDSENPYLYAAAGPKKRIIHGAPEAEADDDVTAFGQWYDPATAAAAFGGSGEYSVDYTGAP